MSLYFRHREGGAQVMRLTEGRDGRIGAEPLAVVSLRSGEVRVQGGREISDAEQAEIDAWLADAVAGRTTREMAEVARTVEAMNLAAGWIGRADAAVVAEAADTLLAAAQDLRLAVVKRLGEEARDAG